MKRIIYILFLLITVGLYQACDVIGEGERFLDIDQVDAKKNVLLVEFTDQTCVNCPRAAVEINQLKERYGNTLIAVAMHAYTIMPLPLVTEEGNTYEKYFETNKIGHPVAVIDGKHREATMSNWAGLVIQQLENEPPVAIGLNSSFNAENRELTIISTLVGMSNVSGLKFQLWLTEDNIVALQQVSATTIDPDYVHNHVFRAAVNGVWGESITITADEEKTLNHSFTLKEEWNPDNMHIIGFVFNDDSKEVFQVVEIKLRK